MEKVEDVESGFEFRDVVFSYPGSEEKVLNGVSFKIKIIINEKMSIMKLFQAFLDHIQMTMYPL